MTISNLVLMRVALDYTFPKVAKKNVEGDS